MKKSSEIILIVLGIIAIIAMYSYAVAATGPVEPLGRAAFVKLLNPDFYPDHPHSQLLEKYAADRGSPWWDAILRSEKSTLTRGAMSSLLLKSISATWNMLFLGSTVPLSYSIFWSPAS